MQKDFSAWITLYNFHVFHNFVNYNNLKNRVDTEFPYT